MSKPRSQSEIDAWNEGARWADAHWADQPHERTVGIEYERVRGRALRTAGGGISDTFEQQETKRQI